MSAYAQEGGSPGGSVYAQKGSAGGGTVVLGPPAPTNLFGKSGQTAAKAATKAAPPPVKVVKVRAHTRTIPVKTPKAATPSGSAGGGSTPLGPAVAESTTYKPPSKPPPTKLAPATPSVRPGEGSTVKRFAPNFATEPVAGHVPFLQNPDRSWVAPGGKFQPGAHIALRPYYTNTNTLSKRAGPPGQESTQWNAATVAKAKQMQVANYGGKPGYIVRSLIPGGLDQSGTTSVAKAITRGVEAGTAVLPGGGAREAAGVLGFGLKAITRLRAGKDVVEAAPAAGALRAGEEATTTAPAAAHTTEAAATIRGAMPGAKILRGKQEAGYSVERGQRVAAGQTHLDNPDLAPTARVAKAKGELAGELPKIKFGGFGELNDQSLEAATDHILNHPHLLFFQKIRAADALAGAMAGRVPTRGEITLLEHVFGKDTAASLPAIANSPWRNRVVSALNVPRSLMASFDLSAPFRQGLVVATRHPAIFGRNLGPMVKAFGSEKVYQAALDEIHARPSYPLMVEAKLPLTELGRDVGGREEQFASNYAETLTGGKYSPVRASGRAYTGFLDKTRADVFDHLLQRAQSQGINVQDPHFLQSLGKYIGSATGRGDLHYFKESAKVLNAVLFSPRLLASRLNFLNPAYYARLHPFARKEALRSAIQLAGTTSTVLALASRVPGVKVNLDPRNPDWGKIRIGNTRIDIAGGFQQELRFLAQFASGTAISSTTGKRLSLTSGGFGQPTRLDIALRFIEGKEAPIASLATDWARGSTQIGQKFSWGSAAAQRMIPLLMQDAHDLYNEKHGGMNGLMAALAGYGVGSVGFGVQTYGPQAPKTKLPLAPAQGPTSGSIYAGKGSSYAGSSYAGSGSSYAGK